MRRSGKVRQVPISDYLHDLIKPLQARNPDGFLFARNPGENPISRTVLIKSLKDALELTGVSREEQKRRFISFHSWCYYFNTILRSNNISDSKVQSLTGYSTLAMTEHYPHFNAGDFEDVKAVQKKIIPFAM